MLLSAIILNGLHSALSFQILRARRLYPQNGTLYSHATYHVLPRYPPSQLSNYPLTLHKTRLTTMTVTNVATAHTTTVQNPRLRLLNTLRSKKPALMTFIAIPSVRHAQIVALTGLDVSAILSDAPGDVGAIFTCETQGVIIDCEHGHIGDDQMHNSVSAISALGVSPIIRVRGPQPDILKRALDTGAQYVQSFLPTMINIRLNTDLSSSDRQWSYGSHDQHSQGSCSRCHLFKIPSLWSSWPRVRFPSYRSRSHHTRVHEDCQRNNLDNRPNRDQARSGKCGGDCCCPRYR